MLTPELNAILQSAAREGACAWWDGYPIDATLHEPNSLARIAFENGWKRARDKAIADGLAVAGADNVYKPTN